MKRGLRAAIAAVCGSLGLVFVVASPTACSSKSCTSGQSVSCTGPGGCAGGQVCNADGTGYGACVCGGTDSGTPDSSTPDAANDSSTNDAGLPTHAALHVTWTIEVMNNASTCANVGAAKVDVQLTPTGDAGTLNGSSFVCTDGMDDLTALAFGTYAVSASLLDNTQQAIKTLPPQNITLGPTGCDAIVGGDCVKNLALAFVL